MSPESLRGFVVSFLFPFVECLCKIDSSLGFLGAEWLHLGLFVVCLQPSVKNPGLLAGFLHFWGFYLELNIGALPPWCFLDDPLLQTIHEDLSFTVRLIKVNSQSSNRDCFFNDDPGVSILYGLRD